MEFKRINKIFITIFIVIILLLQTGCWDLKLFEEIGFILQMGIELDKDDNMLLTVTSPVVSPDVKEKVDFLYTSSEKLIRASRENMRNVSGKMLQGGKIQLIHFSEELARRGINEFFEIYLRDPENPLLANVVVVEGSPKEMMEFSLEYKDKPRPAFYANLLLQDARRRLVVPEVRVFSFSILNYSRSIDPITPILGYNKKNLEVKGSALFSGDKMVGKINTSQTVLLNTLMGKRGGEYIFKQSVPDNGNKVKKGATFLINGAKQKIKIQVNGNIPVISIQQKLNVLLDEYAGAFKLDNQAYKNKLEELVSEAYKADELKLLKYLQEVGSDPIGFGELVRTKNNKYWKAKNWKDTFKKAKFQLNVKTNIKSYGTIN